MVYLPRFVPLFEEVFFVSPLLSFWPLESKPNPSKGFVRSSGGSFCGIGHM